ncbi:MAG: SUMF1/EgtB/PvdO family nonheme iron enzyme [Saprospiraceae bacterium]|nr:SUMF1/EgtB/PvdO family nonheme iron enzyme [Saprospiraceae bacterium]
MKKPVALGLFDMISNVWEWCQDYYDAGYYAKAESTGPDSGQEKVLRGCFWNNAPKCLFLKKL